MSGINKDDLFSKNKTRTISEARHLLYYLCNKRMIAVSYIKKYMEDNGYKIGFFPITYGIKTAKQRVEKDPDYASLISKIDSSILI
jgi:chromosomal replication initiation ATPase DnaA